MSPPNQRPRSRSSAAQANSGFETNILRLVKRAVERRAIKSGQVDAIVDPASGHVILLPEAQAALLERKERFRSLVELSTDGYWEQDEHYRFVLHTGATIGNERSDDNILGKSLWDLSFDNSSSIDWPTHRTQLAWRAIFRDLQCKCVDRDGGLRIISLSGEPMFDAEGLFKGYRGITRDITDLKQSLIDPPESDGFARATLDALATQVCVLDTAGIIIRANTAWRMLAATHRNIGAEADEGSNYLAACDHIVGDERVDAAAMAAAIRQVIAGERDQFRYEYFCDAPSGQRWFMATATRLRGDGAARAIVSYEDITEIKRAERLLRLECAVARRLADANDTSAALQGVLCAVCEALRWDCGRYFCLDAEELLCLSESWGRSTLAVEQFILRSRGVRFRPGAGFAGRVYQSGEPLWMLTETNGTHTLPTVLAHELDGETGMNGAFAFAVIAAGKAIGVLVFTGSTVREPDDRLLQTARSIGNQLGQFLQRRQAEESLRENATRFRQLTELSNDWYWEQDCQFRFTKITGQSMVAAADMLGKTLWELPNIVVDDDEWIKHKSVLAAKWSFCDFECVVVVAERRRRYYRISGEPLYDAAGAFIGFHGTGLDVTQCRHRKTALWCETNV